MSRKSVASMRPLAPRVSAVSDDGPSPSAVPAADDCHDRTILLSGGERQRRQVGKAADFCLHGLVEGEVMLLQGIEVPRERGDGISCFEQWDRQSVPLRLVIGERRLLARYGFGEQLGVAEGVGQPMGGERVLEVASVTNERPTRPEGLPEIAGHTGEADVSASTVGTADPRRQLWKELFDDTAEARREITAVPVCGSHPTDRGEQAVLAVVGRDDTDAGADPDSTN